MLGLDWATTGTTWLDITIAAAAGLTALGVLWTKGIKPAWRALCRGARLLRKAAEAINDVQEAMPVLLTIAEEFKPNGGHSLKDSLTRIESTQQCIQDRLASGREQILGLVSTVDAQGEKLDQLHGYAHDNNHKLTGSLGTMVEAYSGVKYQLGRVLAEQAKVAQALEVRQAKGDTIKTELLEHREVTEHDGEHG